MHMTEPKMAKRRHLSFDINCIKDGDAVIECNTRMLLRDCKRLFLFKRNMGSIVMPYANV